MDYNQIRELLQWIESSNFTSVSLQKGGVHISASKTQYGDMPAPFYPPVAYGAAPVAAAPAVESVASESPAVGVAPAKAPEAAVSGHEVKSPIVGTYYASANPEAAPFVVEGQAVKKGDVLCILEAMKIMNEVTADRDGIVAKVLVENGQMVEARQTLLVIS